jgi:hypothetical protein
LETLSATVGSEPEPGDMLLVSCGGVIEAQAGTGQSATW